MVKDWNVESEGTVLDAVVSGYIESVTTVVNIVEGANVESVTTVVNIVEGANVESVTSLVNMVGEGLELINVDKKIDEWGKSVTKDVECGVVELAISAEDIIEDGYNESSATVVDNVEDGKIDLVVMSTSSSSSSSCIVEVEFAIAADEEIFCVLWITAVMERRIAI